MKPVYCLAIVYESGAIYIDSTFKTEVQLAGLIGTGDRASIKRVLVSEEKKRSLDSNALQAVWIREVSEWSGESIKHVRATVKRDLGLPIIRYEHSTPEEQKMAKMICFTLNKIGYDGMTPAQQLSVTSMFNVTSIMSSKQHKRLLDDMANHYAANGLILVSNKG